MIAFDSAIGIEINRDCMAMVCVQKSLDGLALRRHELVPLPPSVESREQRQRIIIERIADFRRKARAKGNKVFVSIPRDDVLLRYLRLPVSARENLAQVIAYEMERYIPFTPDEVYYDFQVLKEDETVIHILLAAAKRQIVHAYLDTLSLANLRPLSLEVSTTAIFNALVHGTEGTAAPRALIVLAKDHGELILASGRSLVYSRSFAWDNGDGHHFARIRTELQRAFLHISNECPPGAEDVKYEDLKPIVILNGCPKEAVNELSAQTEIPFSFGFRPARLGGLRTDFQAFVAAYGAALKGLKRVASSVNLMPKVQGKPAKQPTLIPTVLLAAGATFLAMSWGSTILSQERQQLQDLNREIDRLKPEIKSVQAMETDIDHLRKNIEVMEKIKQDDFSQLEIMKELTAIVPEKAWLNRFTYGKGKVQIEGQAPSASDLIPQLERSSLFMEAKFPSPITKTPDGLEQFRIEVGIKTQGGGPPKNGDKKK